MIIFDDVMDPGVTLVEVKGFLVPDYLVIDAVMRISLTDRLDPSSLPPSTRVSRLVPTLIPRCSSASFMRGTP